MVNNLSAVKFEGASYYNNILCTVDGVYRYYIGVDTTINGNLISGQIENSVYILFNSSGVVSTVYVANPPVNSWYISSKTERSSSWDGLRLFYVEFAVELYGDEVGEVFDLGEGLGRIVWDR